VSKIACASAVLDLSFSARDAGVLATANHDGSFTLWNWKTGNVVWQNKGHGGSPMHAVRFLTPSVGQKEILLTGGTRCDELKLWDIEKRVCTSSLKFVAPASGQNPFYSHVLPVLGLESFVVVANAKRKDFHCVHISQVTDGDAFVFDNIALFEVSQVNGEKDKSVIASFSNTAVKTSPFSLATPRYEATAISLFTVCRKAECKSTS
jgi:WD40 repeat protein